MKAIALGLAWAACSGLLAAIGMEPSTAKGMGLVCALALGPLVAGATPAGDKDGVK